MQPENGCDCPSGSPILNRWPHYSDKTWRGMDCKEINSNRGGNSRFHINSHIPQMAADGNTSTYWLSNGSNPLSKLDINLGTAYQVSDVT